MDIKAKFSQVKLWILFFAAALVASGCGDESSSPSEAEKERVAITEKIQLVEKAGGLVMVVGGETITSDEIIESPAGRDEAEGKTLAELLKPLAENTGEEVFKEQAKTPVKDVVTGKISGILLYQYAKREIGQNANEALDKMAEKELRKFVLRYGGDEAKADAVLKEKGLDRRKFKEEHKKMIITQSYLSTKLQYRRPVTYGELAEYYETHRDEFFFKPGMVQFRLIDIDMSKVKVADAQSNRTEEARKLGAELAKRIDEGEDFAKLAEEYSNGHRQAFGGLWPEIQPDSLAAPYVVLAERAEDMKPGDIAGPIETVGHIFIMKLEAKETAGYEPLEKAQGRVREMILTDRRNKAIDELNARLLREAAIGQMDEFVDFCVEKIYKMNTKAVETVEGTK
ncbi:MAG: peptidyl-prolyl cis-trans isomerase [Sedimentisphaerales bacterium]|nr:peptidyl-prolyl cis-trans isomerase [Sedimentisphaerales bacterium]